MKREAYGKILCALILALFVGLRLYSWSETVIVEDHDSIAYVAEGKLYRDLDWQGIWNLSADSNPIMPIMGAAFSLFANGDVLAGFRIASFVCSVALFGILIALGKRLGLGGLAINSGLLFLAINPFFVKFSFSALSEPIYLAITGLGLLLLMRFVERVKLLDAVLLAIVFGLAFLTRTEGLLYIAVIPGIMVLRFFFLSERCKNSRKLHFQWILLYCVVFTLVILPQLVRVSSKMGQIGLNGRQVWTLILKNDDGKSYEEKLFGLDHSPVEVNLMYVSDHPETQKEYAATVNPIEYIRVVLNNYEELLFIRLPELVTPLGIVLSCLGFFVLIRSESRNSALLLLVFLAAALVGPLIHNVVVRHIAILGPPMFLAQGAGLAFLVSQSGKSSFHRLPALVAFSVLSLYVSQVAWPLKKAMGYHPSFNREYDHFAIQRFVDVLGRDLDGEERLVVARKVYLPAFSGDRWLPTPYGDYDQLVEYCRGNDAEFLFLEHHLLSGYPFLETFASGEASDEFELIFEEEGVQGEFLRLYKIK